MKLADLVCIRDEIQNLPEWLTIRVAVKADADYILTIPFYSFEDKLLEIRKELGLLYNNTIRIFKWGCLNKGHQFGNSCRRIGFLVVAHDTSFSTVALVEAAC